MVSLRDQAVRQIRTLEALDIGCLLLSAFYAGNVLRRGGWFSPCRWQVRSGICSLLLPAEPAVQIAATSEVKTDVGQFINAMKSDSIDLRQLGMEEMPLG